MTDKQIINGLKYERLTEDQLHDLSQWELVDIILAYRKDLKAKEQECEKAKQNAQDTYDLWQALIESFNILQGEKIKLEQECEELRTERKKLKWDLENNIQVKNHAMEENNKLKQTLTEIKEIAEELKNFYEELGKCECLTVVQLKQILQKISECEVDNG